MAGFAFARADHAKKRPNWLGAGRASRSGMEAQELVLVPEVTVIDAAAILPIGPRERALDEGLASLADVDLLAIVLGTGLAGCPVMVLAQRLLDHHGGLSGLARLSPFSLSAFPGVGLVKALRVTAALEMGRRSLVRAIAPRPTVFSSATVAAWFTSRIGWKDNEELWVIGLDANNGMRSARQVVAGGAHEVSLLPRDVLRVALADGATAFILVHNHPSGDPSPSAEDIRMTNNIVEAALMVGVPVMDHVIVSSTGQYTSMLDLGLL